MDFFKCADDCVDVDFDEIEKRGVADVLGSHERESARLPVEEVLVLDVPVFRAHAEFDCASMV